MTAFRLDAAGIAPRRGRSIPLYPELTKAAEHLFATSALACFAAGVRIDTADGPCPVHEIEEESLVHTLDNGLQPVRRVLSKKVEGTGSLAPVVFRAGALGNKRDLVVSPHHRILLSGWRAELLVGSLEVLASARDLVNGDTVFRLPVAEVEYVHLLFDRHEVIFAEGVATESYHPLLGHTAEDGHDTLAELMRLFPALEAEAQGFGPAARPTLTSGEACLFR